MIRLLSTKILSPRQKEIIESDGIVLQEYNAINISLKKFVLDLSFDHYICTSQNAVRGLLRAIDDLPLPEKRQEAINKEAFCVGKKTAGLLTENGLKVLETAKNSKELAEIIIKSHKNHSFLFICGNRRREELPTILTENTIRYSEIVAYNTLINKQQLDGDFDGVLFYSPSGVQSFTSLNDLSKSRAFCIGESTAKEASRHTDLVVISPHQSIESILETAKDIFSKPRETE